MSLPIPPFYWRQNVLCCIAMDEHIQLDQFLKFAQVVASGGEAKQLVKSGAVRVNDEVELRRGRKLYHGDVVEVDGIEMLVEFGSNQR